MEIRNLKDQESFTTADGSTIRSILDRTNSPVQHQSVAEANLAPGQATRRHYHERSEEIYFILEGNAQLEVDGESRPVGPGDAALLPPGAWHVIRAKTNLRFLCLCAPPYSHEDTYFA